MGTAWVVFTGMLVGLGGEGSGPGAPLTVEDAQVTLLAQVRVPAKEAGVLERLSVKEGELVRAGAELGRLEADLAALDERRARLDYEIARLQSENDVDRRYAGKALEVAGAELERARESVRIYPKSISQTELDRLRLVVEKTTLSREQAERDLQVAELHKDLRQYTLQAAARHVERRTLVAPIDGLVVQIFQQPGEWLHPGDPVLRIIRMDRLRVEAFVDGNQYGSELLDCPVQLTTALPPGERRESFPGRIVFVSPELQPVTGQIRVWAEVENREFRLRPGARGTLSIFNLGRAGREEAPR